MSVIKSLHALETVILLLLILVAVFAVLAHKLKVPYPIVLVLAGLAISFVPHMPRIPLEPSLVFLIFLPPLLYSSAWSTSWREFKRNLGVIGLLAFGLVGFTVWGVAEFSDRFITALDWKAGFLLGAVVSTTDAIAATSIAKSVGLPRRIVDILEGESLMNDATGLLALEIGLSIIVRGQTPTVAEDLTRLLYLVVAGIGIGLVIGVAVSWIEKFIDDGPVELVVSVVVPYAAYLAGEEIRASGVLAVVACGLYMSRQSATFFSPSVRIQVFAGWKALTFVLNGMVFMMIGLQLPYVMAAIHGKYGLATLLEYGAIFSVVLIVLRMVWVYPAAKIAGLVKWKKRQEEPLNRREIFVIGWTGMRGVLALAAAISVPETLENGQPFGPRNLIVFLAFCVILVTLVLQGLSLPSLIRMLGLAGEKGMEPEERNARKVALKEALEFLKEKRIERGEQFSHAYDDLIDRYEHRLADIDEKGGQRVGSKKETYRQMLALGEEAVKAERRTIIRLRNEGLISDDVLRTIESEMDLEETRFQANEMSM
jgi:CPA1 family monovalent cation:H+ antiporter